MEHDRQGVTWIHIDIYPFFRFGIEFDFDLTIYIEAYPSQRVYTSV